MDLELAGIHHLTAITAEAGRNVAFYTGTLGMRLVKKTVNQDDVGAYHLFYGDGAASPGSDITFFDWPAPRERRGTRSVVRTGLRVAGSASLAFWEERLRAAGIGTRRRDGPHGRASLLFEDPEGQRLALVDDGGGRGEAHPWAGSPVPAEHQIRGLGPITLAVPSLEPTARLLTGVLNMRPAGEHPGAAGDRDERGGIVHVFAMGAGGPAAELHVLADPDAPAAGQGAGGVHHVAFRTPDREGQRAWTERLDAMGVPNSGEVERYYFRSLYFREPGGVLFEIATDGPGFAVDEPLEQLGEQLALPPFLEPRRAEIEAGLKPL
jgi:glyoxalase family protein